MTATIATTTPKTRRTVSIPAVAGITYAGAWIVGIAVHPNSPAIDATAQEVAQHYATNGGAGVAQEVFAHGIAGVALVTVAWGVRALALRRNQRRTGDVLLGAAITAGALSLVQMTLGMFLAITASSAHADRADALFDAMNRIDGVKMIALGATVVAGIVLAHRNVLPRWLSIVGDLTVLSLVPSAIAYLTLNANLAVAAAPALLGLLVWFVGAGIVAGRADRH
jgi:hypothetical protein